MLPFSEDLTIKILNCLDEEYKELSNTIQARETEISFGELHEKLLNHEAQLGAMNGSQIILPVTTNIAITSTSSNKPNNRLDGAFASRPPPARHQ